MAKQVRDDEQGLPIKMTSTAALKYKLEVIWVKLTSKSNELVRRAKHIAGLMHLSNPSKLPTVLEICLLICNTFPQDFSIPVDDLVKCMMGLNLFKHVHDMIEARHLIDDIIYDLATHNMIKLCGEENNRLAARTFDEDNTGWLSNELCREKDGYDNQYVKMLADGRDLAKEIASKYGFLFGPKAKTKNLLFWHGSRSQDDDGLFLVLQKCRFSFYPYRPKHALLHLQHGEDSASLPVRISRNLQVLSFNIPSKLPQSLKVPRKLRTLCLKVLKLDNLSWIGGLKYLEFLSMSTLSLRYIPKEMKQLQNLRFLDLRESTNLVYIPPGVLSKMLKLEELYLPFSYNRWGCRGKEDNDHNCFESEEGEKINASFSEIACLSLYALQVSLQEAPILPKKTSTFKRIKQFRILIHNDFKYQPLGEGRMNKLQLTGDACDIKQSGIWDLMQRVEDLGLIGVRNLKNVMSQVEEYEFPQLRKLIIIRCDELEYLVVAAENWIPNNSFTELKYLHLSMLSNLKEIWYGTRPHLRMFENLRQISIRLCHKLKYVFPLSMAKGLRQLKSVEILDCNEMEGVMYESEVGDDNSCETSCIEELHLYSLPMFVGFLANKDCTIDDAVLNDNDLPLTTNEIVSASIERPNCAFDSNFQSFPTNQSAYRFSARVVSDDQVVQQTEIKRAISLTETYCAFSSELMEKQLERLKKLKIAFCEALQIIFLFKGHGATIWVLNSLKVLELYGLHNLRHICFQMPPKISAFENLQHLVLSECHNLYHVFSFRLAKLMFALEKVQIIRCEKMKEIIVKDDDQVEEAMMDKIAFFSLKVLELQHMPNLSVFYGGVSSIQLPSLETLKLHQCNKMESFSYSALSTPKLELIQMNGSSYPLEEDLNTIIKRLKLEKL